MPTGRKFNSCIQGRLAILMKDIHNIAIRAKEQRREEWHCKSVTNNDPARVKTLPDESRKDSQPSVLPLCKLMEGVLMRSFMQYSKMLSAIQRFPEILLIDATHKNNARGCLILWLI